MWVHPHGVDTTGALDLGGASTQITFVAGDVGALNTSDIVQVSLYGYTYTLYTHSFQCYGRNEAEKRFLVSLLQVRWAWRFPGSLLPWVVGDEAGCWLLAPGVTLCPPPILLLLFLPSLSLTDHFW